ncbi:MAG: PSD1 and planctomycete cytochrome C domain-containing protein [Planctomycetaceae bacterium]
MRSGWCLAVILAAFPAFAGEEPLDDATFFRTKVRPVLSDKCFKCHGPGVQEADLRLDERDVAVSELPSGMTAILPGKPDESELIRRIRSDDEFERMPPPEIGKDLTPEQIAALEEWVRRGAPFADHWAYERDPNIAPPTTASEGWRRNPIDAFVLDRLQRAELPPSSPADRETLIRRVSLDLVGLLPSPEEVAAFVADDRPDAYERIVDRLLASPHYGERQARHWLDLARYADSNGYTIDSARTMWPYRDWVIDSFNANKPFDDFTIEQLAADLLPGPTTDQLVATGFQRNTPFNEEGGTDPEQFRVERTVDRTNTIGSVWLGLTVGCSQCHDHKFDAISQQEYYQLYAFSNSVDEPTLPLPTPAQQRDLATLADTIERLKAESTAPTATEEEVKALLAAADEAATHPWANLTPSSVSAEVGSTLTILGDNSILATGDSVPTTDVYHVHATLPAGRVTAIRLEALTHESLPKGGPGRAGNGNFVLSRIDATVAGRPVGFQRAVADHSQENYHVSQALEGDRSKGWAITTKEGNQNVDRTAIFTLSEPIETSEETPIEIRLTFAHQPSYYTLGRMRLSVSDAAPAFVGLPIAIQRRLTDASLADSEARRGELEKALAEKRHGRIAEVEAQRKRLQGEILKTLIIRSQSDPRKSHIHIRGDFLNLGEEVRPDTFASLPPLDASSESATRLDLARWLVRDDHPLTPRVVVNRLWQRCFGRGLVETENDFGVQGSFPTHPKLLDWLAEEFVRSGWNYKHVHRLIVTSATYRQSSTWRDDAFAKDPRNELLARQNRLRVEAEILRDAALSASGLLCEELGGPGVFPPQPDEVFSFTQSQRKWVADEHGDRYRRGMYTFLWRQSQHPLMTTFDGPDAQTSCTRRNRSNTPLQALHLANDQVFVELAEGLADRVQTAPLADDTARLEHAFRLCLAREPTSEERETLLAMLHEQQEKHPETAWLMIARTLLNLDEFVTRE